MPANAHRELTPPPAAAGGASASGSLAAEKAPASRWDAGVGSAMDALDRQLTQLAERGEVGLVVDVDLIRHAGAGSDWMIAAIAERQYGVVSRAQLLAAGIGPG